MSAEYLTRYEWLYNYWSLYCGAYPQNASEYSAVYQKYTDKRDPERRVRVYPLRNHPTIRAKALTSHLFHGYDAWCDTTYVSMCRPPNGWVRCFKEPSKVYNHTELYLPFDYSRWNNRYLDEVRGASSDLSGLVAEIDETAKLIADFVRIAREVSSCISNPLGKTCIRGIRRLKPKSWKDIPSAILLNNFAIQPLCSSLGDVGNRLRDPYYSLYRKFSWKQVDSDIYDDGFLERRRKTVTKTTAYVKLKDNGLLSNQFNIGNPLEWAWERIPFSFVVDWVLPVGNFIGAVGTLNMIESAQGTRSIKSYCNTHEYKLKYSPVNNNPVRYGTRVSKTHTREIIGGPGMPVLFEYKPPKSLTTLTSALSLLAVVHKRDTKNRS
jgi:hypothetical protein